MTIFLYIIAAITAAVIIHGWLGPDYPEGQAFISPSHQGHHYVVYPDGKKSGYMDYRTARDYADMFGGHVYRGPKV